MPVISVGNLTWGGNGKTPMVEFIALCLADSGISPLILTRVPSFFLITYGFHSFFLLVYNLWPQTFKTNLALPATFKEKEKTGALFKLVILVVCLRDHYHVCRVMLEGMKLKCSRGIYLRDL